MDLSEYTNLKRCAETKCDGKSFCHHMKVFELAMNMFDQARPLTKAELLVILLEIGTHCKRLLANPKFFEAAKHQCTNLRLPTLLLTNIDVADYYDTVLEKRTRSGQQY